MKNILLISTMLGMALIISSFTLSPPDKYDVDASTSKVQWTGYHIVKSYSHNGNINIKSGSLEVQDGELISGNVIIDMKSITNEDLTKEKDNTKLVNHLKSEDFFNANEYPESILNITNVKKIGDSKYNVTGDITIRGITEPVEFEATRLNQNDGSVKYSASLKIDRSKHEVLYGWSVENVVISNFFDLKIELVAKKSFN